MTSTASTNGTSLQDTLYYKSIKKAVDFYLKHTSRLTLLVIGKKHN